MARETRTIPKCISFRRGFERAKGPHHALPLFLMVAKDEAAAAVRSFNAMADPGLNPKVPTTSDMATPSFLALRWKVGQDIPLSPQNTKNGPEGIAFAAAGKPDGGGEEEPKQTAPGRQPPIMSTSYIMVGEAAETNGRK